MEEKKEAISSFIILNIPFMVVPSYASLSFFF